MQSTWRDGFEAEHRTGDFALGGEKHAHARTHTIRTDEPLQILGGDGGASPAEVLMSALAACLSVGYAANAAARGIDLESLSFELEADGDLGGFMDTSEARPGLSEIRVKATVEAPRATEEQLRELQAHVDGHSPIFDTIANPVRVRSALQIR